MMIIFLTSIKVNSSIDGGNVLEILLAVLDVMHREDTVTYLWCHDKIRLNKELRLPYCGTEYTYSF